MKKLIVPIALVVTLVSGLTACGSNNDLGPTPTESETLEESLDRAEISRIAMEITFDSSSPEEQAKICLGLELYGREVSKQNLQAYVPPEERYKTDWDVSVDYLIERCAQQ